MPLQITNEYPNGPIKSADMVQIFNLFTGIMVDQPVTFGNTLHVGGNQAAGSAVLRVDGVGGQTANMVELRTLAADVQPVFSIDKTGKIGMGPGGAVGVDTFISRSGVNTITFAATMVFQDSSNHTVFQTASGSGSAVNYLQLKNSATGIGPELDALGTDPNVGIILQGKGTSGVTIPSGGLTVTGQVSVTGNSSFFRAATSPGASLLILPFDDASPTTIPLAVQNAAGAANVWSVTKAGAVTQASSLTVTAGGVGINVAPVTTVALIARGTTNDNSTYALQAQQANGTLAFGVRDDGVTLIQTGGLSVVAGGLTVTLGNVGINVAISAATGLTVRGTTSDNTTYALQAQAANGVMVLGARDDGSVFLGATGGALGFFGSGGAVKQTAAADATDLASAITLLNGLKTILKTNYGMLG